MLIEIPTITLKSRHGEVLMPELYLDCTPDNAKVLLNGLVKYEGAGRDLMEYLHDKGVNKGQDVLFICTHLDLNPAFEAAYEGAGLPYTLDQVFKEKLYGEGVSKGDWNAYYAMTEDNGDPIRFALRLQWVNHVAATIRTTLGE